MTTVCPVHEIEVRPGRRCRRCTPHATPPPPIATTSTRDLSLPEDVFRAARAAGTWPSHLPVPRDPTTTKGTT